MEQPDFAQAFEQQQLDAAAAHQRRSQLGLAALIGGTALLLSTLTQQPQGEMGVHSATKEKAGAKQQK